MHVYVQAPDWKMLSTARQFKENSCNKSFTWPNFYGSETVLQVLRLQYKCESWHAASWCKLRWNGQQMNTEHTGLWNWARSCRFKSHASTVFPCSPPPPSPNIVVNLLRCLCFSSTSSRTFMLLSMSCHLVSLYCFPAFFFLQPNV